MGKIELAESARNGQHDAEEIKDDGRRGAGDGEKGEGFTNGRVREEVRVTAECKFRSIFPSLKAVVGDEEGGGLPITEGLIAIGDWIQERRQNTNHK